VLNQVDSSLVWYGLEEDIALDVMCILQQAKPSERDQSKRRSGIV